MQWRGQVLRQEGLFTVMGFYDIEFLNCYQVTFRATFKSQLIVNRFFYKCAAEFTDPLSDLPELFTDELIPIIANIQHSSLVYNDCTVLELFDTRQSDQWPMVAMTGLLSGDPLPAFFGARWRLFCTDSRVHKGRKIFAGITEACVDGDNLNGTYTAEWAAVSAKLAEVLIFGDFTFTPVLLSPANTRHAGDLSPTLYYAGWAGWSTQGSRKVGRGA